MSRILIVYGTTEGHTRKIAQKVGEWVNARGHQAEVIDSTEVPADLNLDNYAAAIIAGSLHQGSHQKPLRHFVRENAMELSRMPTALLSVSLTAAGKDDRHRDEAQECVDKFYEETSWTASQWLPVAGALKYTKYDWMKRFIMREISRKEGGDVDTSQDYEYTDWPGLEQFVDEFLSSAVPVPA